MSLDRAKKKEKEKAARVAARFPQDGHGPRDLFSVCSSRCASRSPKEHMSRPLFQDRLFVPLLSKTISKKNKGTSGLSDMLETHRSASAGALVQKSTRAKNTRSARRRAVAAVALWWRQIATGQRGSRKKGKRTNPQVFFAHARHSTGKNAAATRAKKRRTQHQKGKEKDKQPTKRLDCRVFARAEPRQKPSEKKEE